ncbi:hypothetical protein SK571_27605 [Lentzea sp. BCCO 10_0798]|uniref:Uncharacterized protein n=1 Tax=Lentzea kristufekii TaxID=3095430 RepID=A0ABU4TY78_9PSEU|nr:hypothetical protein [Lentzea sp. BCCO 10_0798]MDX8053162.1 hypothetical protein [Lentzea sp. BCCO 10_0798]
MRIALAVVGMLVMFVVAISVLFIGFLGVTPSGRAMARASPR